MAIVTKPNVFTGGTTAYSSEVNDNFDTIFNDYNGNISNANISATANIDESKIAFTGTKVVRLTGDQTIAGIKTFTSFPITPSSAPTTDYQVANKKYVDDTVAAVPVAYATGFGAWTSGTFNAATQVTEDSLLVCYTSNFTGAFSIKSDSANPPTTIRQLISAVSNSAVSSCIPIRANDYYLVQCTGGGTATVFTIAIT